MTDGDRAWLALLAGVVAYDYWAYRSNTDTLSQSFDRAMSSRWRRWPTLITWAYLTAHLFNRRRNR